MSASTTPGMKTGQPWPSGPLRQSSSLGAHLKTLERKIPLRAAYENFVDGRWIAPVKSAYVDNVSPTTGQVICKVARSGADQQSRNVRVSDGEKALGFF